MALEVNPEAAGIDAARLIEERVARVVAHTRAAIRAFVEGGEQQAGLPPPAVVRAADVERYVAEWSSLVPTDPAIRAAAARELAARRGVSPGATPKAADLLGLDPFTHDHGEASRPAEPPPADAAEALLRRIEQDAEWVRLARGQMLTRQGDPADAMYIMVSGRLRVFVAGDAGRERMVGEMGRGDAIGEMGLISGERRTATLYASRDCELVRLPKEAFDRLVEEHPRFLLSITRQIVDRLRLSGSRRRTRSTLATIAVIPASPDAPLAAVADRLVESLGAFGDVALIDRDSLDRALGDGTVERIERDANDQRTMAWIAAREETSRYVVYRADAGPTAWTQRCIQQADHLLLVANGEGSGELSEVERRLAPRDPRSSPSRGLVLIHPRRDVLPRNTMRWLRERDLDVHDHAHLATPTDFDRLARRMTGRAIGLVLGGGGARGLSHVGAIEALRDARIPIDVVGGTSMGAIIGALLALEWSSEEMRRRLEEMYRSPKLDLTLPIVSLMTGQAMSEGIGQMTGDAQIEDLWIPFFCCSSNLTRGEVMVHQRGSLRRYLRASGSVGGIMPPVTDDGDLLIDGGVLNNLPADVMRRFCPDGSVIAVNVNPRTGLRSAIAYGESLSLRQVVSEHVRRPTRRLRVPNVFDTMERITMLASIQQSSELARSTIDLYLHPTTDDIPFAAFKGTTNRAADRAYGYARSLVEEWRAAQPQAVHWRTRDNAPPPRQ
jgi:predicted acylesterase/phospholipase RssA/CRP-like cAMP-binding protein